MPGASTSSPSESFDSGSQAAELLAIARAIGVEAGSLIAHRRAEGVTIAASKSAPEDVVTFADRESEDFIRARLAELRPEDGFLGEESTGSATPGTSGIVWVVDPIDGTVNYLYDIPAYAVSIAAVAVTPGDPIDAEHWQALAGVVVNPVLGEVFSASLGGGAHLGDRRLQANTGVELSQALVGTGFAYSAELRVKQAAVVQGLVGRVRDIRRAGSAALDLCSVAAGRLDAYGERGLNAWDHAAGALIAREAGARVSGFEGAAESTIMTFAAAPDLADQLEPLFFDLHKAAGLPL
ncbi:inositol monophosphatase [Herbiconiux sp. CPCC 203407]|uniref:Inositol-1-monophosphatase n=1 Tax=Herbiconiux oxytropis TaxID=2970915 RepID=A0AA41XIL5_9MICO|nr:inositol monophosphatase family protein [Herbiconiux oxytropis]MCS5723821.1 inositol monophosphatase [Herbiconiux oxytropis]MCS5726603.1 inositol monophosphatase [Herbiconiux oxytropis]